MKNLWCILLAALSLLYCPVQAAIIQTSNINDILEIVDENTLIIFDLNDTLMTTAQQLGSDLWAKEEIAARIKSSGRSRAQVLDEFIPLWHKILLATKVKPVEPTTADVVWALQRKGCQTLGLTARYIEMAYPTLNQLHSIDIDLNTRPLSEYDLEVEGGFAAKFIEGILFVGLKNDRGLTLWRFFDAIGVNPTKILFVDDQRRNIENVQKATADRGVDFNGVHYTHIQEKGPVTDLRITNQQMKSFGRTLGDDECRLLLSQAEESNG